MDVLNGHISEVLRNLPEDEQETINSILARHDIQISLRESKQLSSNNENKENVPDHGMYKLATHRGYMSGRKLKALTMQNIEADLTEECGCYDRCLDPSDKYFVLRWRQKYHLCPGGFDQQLQLFKIFRETKVADQSGQIVGHIIEGKYICRISFFKQLLKISERTYFRIQKSVKSGTEYLIKAPREIPNGDRGMIALGYMANLVKVMGDRSPETGRILLPAGLTVGEIFKRYKTIYVDGTESIKESRFYSLWKENFKNVSHQQRHSNFSTCNVCLMAKEVLESKHPPEVHQATRQEWDEHLVRQQKERLSYYERRNEAVEHPQEVISMIIDGMDQAKTNIPHFQGWEVPKACDKSKLLQTHVTGVLMHGITTYAMIDILQWPHDSNLTLNCLLYTLAKESIEGVLPRKLYIQLDNCARENKNKFFIGLMTLLVLQGYFDEIWMSFLMVGHTHEDIDARFSKISSKLRINSAKTLPELKQVIQSCIVSGMKPVMLPKVFNIKDWMLPVLSDIHNHSTPHIYRFLKDRQNHVAVKYKDWSTDLEWKPTSTEEQLSIFKTSTNGQYILPEGIPLEIEPDVDRKQTVSLIQENIEKLKPFLKFDQAEWWKSFFLNPVSLSEYDTNQEWYLNLLKCDDKTPDSVHDRNISETFSTSPLSIFMNKERTSRKVYTGKRQSLCSIMKAQNAKRQMLEPGNGFLVLFKDENGEVGIGEVSEIIQENLQIQLYRGHLNGEWYIAKDGTEQCFKVEIKSEWILDDMIFQLTDKKCLPSRVRTVLKQYL